MNEHSRYKDSRVILRTGRKIMKMIIFGHTGDILAPPGGISAIFGDFLKNPYFDPSQGSKIGQKWSFLTKNDHFGPEMAIFDPKMG